MKPVGQTHTKDLLALHNLREDEYKRIAASSRPGTESHGTWYVIRHVVGALLVQGARAFI